MKPVSPSPVLRSIASLLVLIGYASGCTDAEPATLEPVVRDSADVLIQEFPAGVLEHPASFGLAEIPGVRIGVVEGASDYQWARPVAAVRLSDGGFAVLEQVPAEIRVFDSSGQFLHRVGAAGDGPGEFRSPVGLAALADDTLLVWDRGVQRLSWFSIDGTLEHEQTLREPGGLQTIRRVALPSSGAVVVLGAMTTEEDLGNQGRVRETWHVVPVEPDGQARPSLGTIGGTERAIQVQRSNSGQVTSMNVQGRWWWGEGFAWASDRGVWTADQLSFEARHFDPELGMDRIVRINAEGRPFTSALIDSLHRIELDRVDDAAIRELWRADFEGREYPQSIPPVAAVFADMAARVWIGVTEPPPERLPSGELPAVRRWVIFEQGAMRGNEDPAALDLLGILTLPPRSHPLWADEAGVLLVRVDAELDVPYIEWYPFMADEDVG